MKEGDMDENTAPKIELTGSEAQRYEARADVIAASEPIEVLFAIAAKLGFVDSLGGSEYRGWAREEATRRARESKAG